ncbi:protein Flattop [Anableps anableps]
MSSSFSANQFDSAFKPQRLQNWCESKPFKERPSAQVGHTSFIADSRGHLLPGVKKGSTWPDFKGTWDLPARIPAHHINSTARSVEGLHRLKLWGFCPSQKGKYLTDRDSRNTDVGKQTSEDVHQYVADPSTGAEARPESQNCPITGTESHSSQRHEAGSPAEKALQDMPKCATEENQSLICTTGSETHNRHHRDGTPQSIMSKRAAASASRQTDTQRQQDH